MEFKDSIDFGTNGDDEIFLDLPSEIVEVAKTAKNELHPEKSRDRYDAAYEKFSAWQKTTKTDLISESVLLAYFKTLSENYQPSTLWSQYSMLKSVIINQRNVNIGNYSLLTAFLKRKSKGFQSTKAKVLEATEMERFLNEAPDNRWLATKVGALSNLNK